MKKLNRVLGWIGIAILVIAVPLIVFMFIGPRFGWETHPVMSGSMEPALKVGGLIVTKPIKLRKIEVGDIITFKTGEQKVTHRVTGIIEQEGKPWFQTKGDANEEPDPNFVSSNEEEMRKVVLHFSYLGFAAIFMKSKLAFLPLVGIPALLLIGMYTREIYKEIKEWKKKRRGRS